MATKPKFTAAKSPATLSPEQAAFIDKGHGKDKPAAPGGKTAKMSVDLPEELHARFKAACAMTRNKMGPEITAFIERRTAELEKAAWGNARP